MKSLLFVLFLLFSSSVDADTGTCQPDLYTYEAKLLIRENNRPSVYDGDTVWLRVRLGFGVELDLGSTRLYGINAPERYDVGGLEARDRLTELLPEDEWFLIKTVQDKKGKYGRWLVILCPNQTNVNQQLVDENFAEIADY